MMIVDVAIVGPGHVGATAALAFAARGLSVALIGPAAARRDGRTVAVMNAGWDMLGEHGVTASLHDVSAPLAMMRLVDDTGSLFRRPPTEFRASEIGFDQFGWNVEAATLAAAILAAAEGHPRIRRFEAPVTALEPSEDIVTIRMKDGASLGARLAVGADGRKSAVRAAAGIATRDWAYPQTALTTILSHKRPHRDASTEFHTRSGPCTLVPLPGNHSSLVWMMEPAEAERVMALDDAALALAVERRTHSILGAFSIDGPRGLTPMGGLSVERYAGRRVALIGEAAHVFPPIGAQGLNLGLRDAASLVEAVDAVDAGAEPGLSRYEASRRADVPLRTRAVDALNRSLLADFLPVDFARGLGLLALDSIGPLRRFAMRQGLSPGRA